MILLLLLHIHLAGRKQYWPQDIHTYRYVFVMLMGHRFLRFAYLRSQDLMIFMSTGDKVTAPFPYICTSVHCMSHHSIIIKRKCMALLGACAHIQYHTQQ